MTKRLANQIMSRRAARIFRRISRHLPSEGTVADIGSGTGHNAELLRRQTSLQVREFDVQDLHWIGPPPEQIVNGRIPADDESVDAALLLFVLQYPADATALLTEAARITAGPIIVLQSTFAGGIAKSILKLREFFFGRFGYYLARAAKLVAAKNCPLIPAQYFTRSQLAEIFASAGLEIVATESEIQPLLKLHRDLFVLRPCEATSYECARNLHHHSGPERRTPDRADA